MRQRFQRAVASLAVPIFLAHGQAQATEQMVEISAPAGYVSQRLPAGTREVELVTQRAGSCRFGRTWGYDLGRQELWADGCSGTFKVISHEAAAGASPNSSNVAAGVAAAAAIAGIAILASQGRKHDNQPNSPAYYPPSNNPGYSPPSAGYYPPSAGYYPPGGGRQGTIHGPGGLCLDMRGDSVRQGTDAIVYRCHGRNNQRFSWTPRGELIVANMCLDIAGGSNQNGARVIAWPCNGGRNQQWYVNGAQIRSRQNGRCLDVAGGRIVEGAQVIVWDCHGGANQRWFW